MSVTTEAWVLYKGKDPKRTEPATLVREHYTFEEITDQEVLVESLYGCWEGNMSHALDRKPVDICHQRKEEKVVIGNAGVVRILKCGKAVTTVKEGDIALLFCNGKWDKFGYPEKILGYDAEGTIGLLARQTKLHQYQVIPLPDKSRFTPQQWAAFSLRYITAWSNWNLAYHVWRVQMTEEDCPAPHVWGWGGGVSYAELALAKFSGCRVAMLSANDERLCEFKKMGIIPIDRRQFPDLEFSDQRYQIDLEYKRAYLESEQKFLSTVNELTSGLGVSIFIDYVGSPVFRATIKALARQGVVTTAGWKHGMTITTYRAMECINRHQMVHTHYARYPQGRAAVRFAEETGWMPQLNGQKEYSFDDIPQLAQDYADGKCSYFPMYRVNGC
ncbi:MAG TPA: zinc-binding alcohol dehydrogenase family protein [Bacteroidota bacterium]|nr:zinc-binding alcohol dehydrogenase family protein [Bacteroidota bacterium]